MLAMRTLVNGIGTEMALFKDLAKVPNDQVRNFRNDMYLASEALRIMQKSGKPQLAAADVAVLKNYKNHIHRATRFTYRSGSRSLSHSLLASAPWSDGSASSSRSARKSARTT